MNWPKSIYVGDHIWFGQNAMIFKGSKIGSGSIIGANSVVSNKRIPSNTTYAGAPLRLIHENTFWTPHSVHGWNDEEIKKMSESDSDLFSYSPDENTSDFDEIESILNSSNQDDTVEYVLMFLFAGKNRFCLK